MNKLVAMSCCVMLASSPMALAQAPAAKRTPSLTAKEQADKTTGEKRRMEDCTKNAKGRNLQAGHEFDRYMTDCLKG